MTTLFQKKMQIPLALESIFQRIHFIGIGGIGMSGLAEILLGLGYRVQGSDQNSNGNTERLLAQGAEIFQGHDAAYMEDVTLVVRSTAISPKNPELLEAQRKGITIIHRSELLAALMQGSLSVSVTGTHGKTTTTAMVGQMMLSADYDPTIINGGIIHNVGSNVRLGNGNMVIAEADESDRSFLALPTRLGVVTNMDPEHLEFYNNDFDVQRECYRQFVKAIPFYGAAILCIDHPEIQALSETEMACTKVTYGFDDSAHIYATRIESTTAGSTFDVVIQMSDNQVIYQGCYLSVPGKHNIQNALAAVAVAYLSGVEEDKIKLGLSHFTGVKRRFTKTGEVNHITFIDDYAHHPVEIVATLQMARQATQGKVIAVIEPHKFTRLKYHFDDFATSLKGADISFVKDVYSAGEEPIEGIDAEALVARAVNDYGVACQYVDSASSVVAEALPHANPGDIVICLGAGKSSEWAYSLPRLWEEMHATSREVNQ